VAVAARKPKGSMLLGKVARVIKRCQQCSLDFGQSSHLLVVNTHIACLLTVCARVQGWHTSKAGVVLGLLVKFSLCLAHKVVDIINACPVVMSTGHGVSCRTSCLLWQSVCCSKQTWLCVCLRCTWVLDKSPSRCSDLVSADGTAWGTFCHFSHVQSDPDPSVACYFGPSTEKQAAKCPPISAPSHLTKQEMLPCAAAGFGG
jgi:hypothetical protein